MGRKGHWSDSKKGEDTHGKHLKCHKGIKVYMRALPLEVREKAKVVLQGRKRVIAGVSPAKGWGGKET